MEASQVPEQNKKDNVIMQLEHIDQTVDSKAVFCIHLFELRPFFLKSNNVLTGRSQPIPCMMPV